MHKHHEAKEPTQNAVEIGHGGHLNALKPAVGGTGHSARVSASDHGRTNQAIHRVHHLGRGEELAFRIELNIGYTKPHGNRHHAGDTGNGYHHLGHLHQNRANHPSETYRHIDEQASGHQAEHRKHSHPNAAEENADGDHHCFHCNHHLDVR